MYTIKNDIINGIVIKNSRFITIIKKVITTNDIKNILQQIKTEYPKATHYCYAYILDEEKKANDDHEPPNTAGLPILNVLEKQDLNHVLAVVVRYFGGIKLGAGGLVRAYSKSVREALKKEEKIQLVKAKLIELEIDYKEQKQIERLLTNSIIIKSDFKEKITYQILIEEDNLKLFFQYSYQVIGDSWIEK